MRAAVGGLDRGAIPGLRTGEDRVTKARCEAWNTPCGEADPALGASLPRLGRQRMGITQHVSHRIQAMKITGTL